MFIVWVGGVIDYEGKDYELALSAYDTWLSLGYEDVKLETLEASK